MRAALGHAAPVEHDNLVHGLQAGQPVVFGPLTCSLAGVTVGKETLPWPEVDALERAQDKLEMKEEKGAATFNYVRGRTRDLRSHVKLFALPNKTEYKLAK